MNRKKLMEIFFKLDHFLKQNNKEKKIGGNEKKIIAVNTYEVEEIIVKD